MTTANEALAILRPWLQSVERVAFRPVVEDGLGAPEGSRFNGRPWLLEGEEWPACKSCGKSMALFLQLDLDAMPPPYQGEFGSGLLQLFYCVRCPHDGFDPANEEGKLVRVIGLYGGALAAHDWTGVDAEEIAITGWEPLVETPSFEEADDAGLSTEAGRDGRLRCIFAAEKIETGQIDASEAERFIESAFTAQPGDKLGGWPHWVQGVEYPECRECGDRMRLVFQIDSEDNVPFMFGDVGCGHVTQCATHKHVVAFGWACY